MKKVAFFLSGAMLMLGVAFSSCSKSNESLIKEYSELCDEIVEAAKDNDLAKLNSLSEQGQKLVEKMETCDFTPEEKAQIEKITIEMTGALGEAAANSTTNSLDELGF